MICSSFSTSGESILSILFCIRDQIFFFEKGFGHFLVMFPIQHVLSIRAQCSWNVSVDGYFSKLSLSQHFITFLVAYTFSKWSLSASMLCITFKYKIRKELIIPQNHQSLENLDLLTGLIKRIFRNIKSFLV